MGRQLDRLEDPARTLPNAMVSTLKFVSLFLHAELTVMRHCVRPFTGTYVTAQ